VTGAMSSTKDIIGARNLPMTTAMSGWGGYQLSKRLSCRAGEDYCVGTRVLPGRFLT
jgi:hypothetical protein